MDIAATWKEWMSVFNGWNEWVLNIIQIAGVLLLAWLIYLASKKWLSRLVRRIAGQTATRWDDLLFDQRFFNRLGILIAPAAIRVIVLHSGWNDISWLTKLLDMWIAVAIVLFVTTILGGINRIYESYTISRSKPIKVFVQVIEIFLYCALAIILFSILLDKDPQNLLVGLGAFAAVLMLVFKDSILGLVAGVQLSAHNMVRIGDWIEMPSSRADGDVLEINLTTVKVQNWDKTITTIPTYKLVSESFTNWRGMQESEGRRIKRSVNIDIFSVHYLTEAELERLKQSQLLRDYIERKIAEIREYNANRGNLLDERRLTNIGTFREYMESWLSSNPDINQEMTHMVRQLQPGPTGIPLEIYCFSARQAWVQYERVQADIFDHLFAIMPLFNLRVFQYTGIAAAQEDR